jgi:hypothetical protein
LVFLFIYRFGFLYGFLLRPEPPVAGLAQAVAELYLPMDSQTDTGNARMTILKMRRGSLSRVPASPVIFFFPPVCCCLSTSLPSSCLSALPSAAEAVVPGRRGESGPVPPCGQGRRAGARRPCARPGCEAARGRPALAGRRTRGHAPAKGGRGQLDYIIRGARGEKADVRAVFPGNILGLKAENR